MNQTLTSIPELKAPDSTVEYQLHPKVVAVWTQIIWIVISIPALGGAIVSVIFGPWFLAPLVLVAASLFPWALKRYYRRYQRAFRCTLSPLGLMIVRGVWWRSQTFVPRQRVQHTDVDQGPLARRHGMASLKIFTAGSEHSQIKVDGLRHEDAIEVRDDLIDRGEPKA